jgi:hypothetical protein
MYSAASKRAAGEGKLDDQAKENPHAVTKQVFSPFEDRAINDIEMIVLEFARRRLRFELQAFLTNILHGIVPWLESDKRRGVGRSFVDQLTPDSNSKIKIRCRKRRMAVHDTRLSARSLLPR